MLDALRAASLDNTLETETSRLVRIDLLIIDDFAFRLLAAAITDPF